VIRCGRTYVLRFYRKQPISNESHTDNYQRENYIRPYLTDVALKTYPLDRADDPSFLRCEPYGFAQQFIASNGKNFAEAARKSAQGLRDAIRLAAGLR